MLIHDFVCISAPVAAVASLVEEGDEWLAPLALSAVEHGETLLVRAGPVEHRLLGKQVRMTVGPPRHRGDTLVLPIHWEATGPSALFPVLDADLEFAPIGPGQTQLNLWGTYDPPLDSLGTRLDRLVFHRVAEATVRAFLARMGTSIEAAAPPAQGSGSR